MDKAFAAFIVATGASFALYRLTFDIQPVLAPAPTVKLVLASHDLEPGTIIQAGDLVLTDWLGEVPASAFSHTQDVVGRSVISRIHAREPILKNRLAPKEGAADSPAYPSG
jgi:Flp pilus assembly protein CpaB